MSTVKHGDDWRRWLSGAIISCGFFPVLRCWYLYCWIRKQPKCESPDTQSRLLTCMNKNMQFLCPHAIASHRTFTHIYRPHSCTTIDSFACVHFSASVNTCTSFWKAGPADVLPVSTGRQADEQQAHPHLGVCLVLSSPCFWDGYWDLQTGFVFIFEDFMVQVDLHDFLSPRALPVCSLRWALRNPVLRDMLSFSPHHQGAAVFNLLSFILPLRRESV